MNLKNISIKLYIYFNVKMSAYLFHPWGSLVGIALALIFMNISGLVNLSGYKLVGYKLYIQYYLLLHNLNVNTSSVTYHH